MIVAHQPVSRDPLSLIAGREVFKAVGRYYYLSGRQIRDLLYDRNSDASRKYALDWLKRLTDAGLLVAANAYERGAVKGSNEWVWSRTEKGRNALDRMGYPSPVAVPKRQKLSDEYLGHLRVVNDCLIPFERFGRETPDVELRKQYHDLELKTFPAMGKVLDGYVGYFLDRYQAPMGIGLEVDRGTERRYPDRTGAASWDDSVKRLIALASGPHVAAFGIQSLTIAVVIRSIRKANRERLADLLRWTEEALPSPAWCDLFRFTIADPTAMSPSEFVGGNHWVRLLGNSVYEEVPLVQL